MRDIYGNTVILYSNHGQLYVTQCQAVMRIQLANNEKCYEFIPVTFSVNGTNTTCYLTQDRIIRPHSKEVNCADKRTLKIRLTNYTLVYQGNIAFKDVGLRTRRINLSNRNISELNFNHRLDLIDSVDALNELFTMSIYIL